MKKIAWGTSKLLEMYLVEAGKDHFSYYIDDFSSKKEFLGIERRHSSVLRKEKKGSYKIIVFAVSNRSLQEISIKLNDLGLEYGKDFIYYSDFFYQNFVKKIKRDLGVKIDPKIYQFAFSFTLNSRSLLHTTILGSWLFLELIKQVDKLKGQIAEVGAYEGGNSLCALNFMTYLNSKRFYILDSFEGFPELNINDPKEHKKGDYNIKVSFNEIKDRFFIFPQAKLLKDFVPASFKRIPKNEKFSLVFYDCDLYQPALDTFKFFWPRIVRGGYLIIHDYKTEAGGFTGVKKATDQFFADKKIKLVSFFENTMAVIKKP